MSMPNDRTLIDCLSGFGEVQLESNVRPEYLHKWQEFSRNGALRLESLLAEVETLKAEKQRLAECLRRVDSDCTYCAQAWKVNVKVCDGAPNCKECPSDDCRCKTCSDNSNWEWVGLNHPKAAKP